MINKILGTAGSKVIIAAIGLLILFLNARYLKAEGLGTIGLIVLGITVILLMNNLVGGTTLVYLIPREENFKLLFISYIWTAIVITLFWILVNFIEFVPPGFKNHVLILSAIFSLSNVNLYLMLGKEKIRAYNVITTLQSLVQLIALFVLFILLKKVSVKYFVMTLYFSYGFCWITSTLMVYRLVKRSDLQGLWGITRKILRLGSLIQVAYLVQMMNYRLSYYIIQFYIGKAGVGMFHLSNQLAEGTWIVGKSIAVVQYSRIANTKDLEYAGRLTLRLFKLTLLATLAMVIALLLIPSSFFQFFAKDFGNTRLILLSLSIGIVSNAVAMMMSHYFAGLGKPQINTIGSLIGLVFTVLLGFWLIPVYGIIGAGITASVSYFIILVYEVFMFIKTAKPKASDFLISRRDYIFLKEEWKKMREKKAQDRVSNIIIPD